LFIDFAKAFDSTNHNKLKLLLKKFLFNTDPFLYYLIEFVLENYSGGISLNDTVKINKGNP
jgi:hypothetical protein